MANITRFDPFSQPTNLEPFGDDFFKGFALRPIFRKMEIEPEMRVDMTEDEKTYVVKAEIPGVKKDDIKVSFDGNRVMISAEVKKEKEEKEGKKLIRSERYYGSVSRSFSLAQDVDQATAKAKYTDGVLEVTLPKKPGSTPMKIEIS